MTSEQPTQDATLDLDRLLRLRLTLGRHGEMDRAGWWNTNGMLGRYGAIALERGLPRTHYFAQARAVFAVAREVGEQERRPVARRVPPQDRTARLGGG